MAQGLRADNCQFDFNGVAATMSRCCSNQLGALGKGLVIDVGIMATVWQCDSITVSTRLTDRIYQPTDCLSSVEGVFPVVASISWLIANAAKQQHDTTTTTLTTTTRRWFTNNKKIKLFATCWLWCRFSIARCLGTRTQGEKKTTGNWKQAQVTVVRNGTLLPLVGEFNRKKSWLKHILRPIGFESIAQRRAAIQ